VFEGKRPKQLDIAGIIWYETVIMRSMGESPGIDLDAVFVFIAL
jgi:hypothetical protein